MHFHMKKTILVLSALLLLFPVISPAEEGFLLEDAASIGEAAFFTRTDAEVDAFVRPERPMVEAISPAVIIEPAAQPSAPAPADSDSAAVRGTSVTASGVSTQYEQTKAFVERMYEVVLNREPDSEGLTNWVAGLLDGTSTAADIVSGLFNSTEYQLRNKTNKEIVTDCYQAMLGREPDEAGLDAWADALEIGMTSQAILAGFVGSQEFGNLAAEYGITPGSIRLFSARDENYERTYFVYRLYANCLGRIPDPVGQESWCRALSTNNTGAQVASGFVFSSELDNYHLNNYEFVWMLYETILGREPSYADLQAWGDALNYSSTRERVFNGFLFSPEFALQCARSGINVGATIPEPDSTDAWKNNIAVLTLLNQYRTAYGLSKLSTREDLWRDVAMLRTAEVGSLFSHTRPNGTSCWTAYEEAGLDYYITAAENIAIGYRTAEAVVEGWMNSPGHRANILNGNLEEVATGYIYDASKTNRISWSQNFITLAW